MPTNQRFNTKMPVRPLQIQLKKGGWYVVVEIKKRKGMKNK